MEIFGRGIAWCIAYMPGLWMQGMVYRGVSCSKIVFGNGHCLLDLDNSNPLATLMNIVKASYMLKQHSHRDLVGSHIDLNNSNPLPLATLMNIIEASYMPK